MNQVTNEWLIISHVSYVELQLCTVERALYSHFRHDPQRMQAAMSFELRINC